MKNCFRSKLCDWAFCCSACCWDLVFSCSAFIFCSAASLRCWACCSCWIIRSWRVLLGELEVFPEFDTCTDDVPSSDWIVTSPGWSESYVFVFPFVVIEICVLVLEDELLTEVEDEVSETLTLEVDEPETSLET